MTSASPTLLNPRPPAAPTGPVPECDAVGLTDDHARQVMALLPRVGCVFADAGRWWLVVPSQSDLGVAWPPMARYAVGARPPGPADPATGTRSGPRLVHASDDAVPFTHPLLLYIAVCTVAGVSPAATMP